MPEKIIKENRFDLDHEGYRLQLKTVSPFRIVQELVSNSFDEKSVVITNVYVNPLKGKVEVRVHDDGHGFADILDVYTLYKYSEKRKDTQQRGRFNLGEKQFLALADYGYVKTKKHLIEFKGKNRITTEIEPFEGAEIYGIIDWKPEVVQEILKNLHRILVPNNKRLFVNDTEVKRQNPVTSFHDTLWTLVENKETLELRRAFKTTTIELYEKDPTEDSWLYELGMPVVKLKGGIDWHVNVRQKIPLPPSRNAVTESWLKDLYGAVLNNAHALVNEDSSGEEWVQEGMIKATKETAQEILTKQFGKERVMVPSSNDYLANEQALEAGVALLPKGVFGRKARSHLGEIGVIEQAGIVFKSSWVQSKALEPTAEMINFARLVELVAKDTIEKDVKSKFVDAPEATVDAQYHDGKITWNVANLAGHEKFFEEISPKMIELITHELAHDRIGNNDGFAHLNHKYVDEVCRIAGIIGYHGINYWTEQVGNTDW